MTAGTGSERFVVGIDLGTTHTVVAHAELSGSGGSAVHDDAIPQTTAPGEVASLENLPSAVYIAAKDEQPASAARLPWHAGSPERAVFLGAWARAQGARVPGRLIVSAKSWLSVAGVDRTSPILPWAAAEGVEKMSPIDVQAALLGHVRGAWDHAHPDAPLAQQEVVVTVPASFDEPARKLTIEAAQRAGLAQARLLEEPQAALYAFLQAHANTLVKDLEGVRLVLVVDVGGGTTDLTLVVVEPSNASGGTPAPPKLERIAVGEHLMLGGDNMDITLARFVEKELTGTIGALDAATWGALVESARLAKESLLAKNAPETHGVSLVSRSSKLVGGTKTRAVTRAEAESILLDGFFPNIARDDVPQRRARTALTELGLPFAHEPAVTRHVLAFLRRFAEQAAQSGARIVDGVPRPDAIILNGGVFKSTAIRKRFLDTVASWVGEPVPLLGDDDTGAALDHAVARGAAYSGLVRRGRGLRIGGGSARAYFVGVGASGTSTNAERALCVVPKGMHEGERIAVDRTFRLLLDRPVAFPLYTSTSSTARAGEVVDVTQDLEALPPLQSVLASEPEVPVRVEAFFSEIGTLELALKMTDEALRRFSLSFSTRATEGSVDAASGAAKPGEVPKAEGLPKRMEEGRDLVLAFYGNKSKDVDKAKVKDLRRDLEKIFGLRDTWSTGLNRELGGAFLGGAKNRRRSVDHERTFFQMVGFTLRPGFGAPFDDWRIEQLWPLWKEGVQNVSEKPTWSSWWILWRRVAGGLNAERQREIGDYLKPWLLEQGTGKKGQGPTPHGQDEMVRLWASLERLPASDKIEAGEFVMKKLGRGGVTSWWPVGRFGARELRQGSNHDVIAPEIAAKWIDRIFNVDLKTAEGAAFALAQIARVTGDRARDLDDRLRTKVAERLEKSGAPKHLAQMVRERVEWTADDDAQSFGEALPPGLRL